MSSKLLFLVSLCCQTPLFPSSSSPPKSQHPLVYLLHLHIVWQLSEIAKITTSWKNLFYPQLWHKPPSLMTTWYLETKCDFHEIETKRTVFLPFPPCPPCPLLNCAFTCGPCSCSPGWLAGHLGKVFLESNCSAANCWRSHRCFGARC